VERRHEPKFGRSAVAREFVLNAIIASAARPAFEPGCFAELLDLFSGCDPLTASALLVAIDRLVAASPELTGTALKVVRTFANSTDAELN
jgi:hypothetical protein